MRILNTKNNLGDWCVESDREIQFLKRIIHEMEEKYNILKHSDLLQEKQICEIFFVCYKNPLFDHVKCLV